MQVISYIGIGSNLGDRQKNISRVVKEISFLKNTKLIKLSRIIESEPLGGDFNQPKFFNAVIKIRTGLKAQALLKALQRVEVKLGRPKEHAFWGPRRIDLDILFYGNLIIEERVLSVPHPGISGRPFVIKPLLELEGL